MLEPVRESSSASHGLSHLIFLVGSVIPTAVVNPVELSPGFPFLDWAPNAADLRFDYGFFTYHSDLPLPSTTRISYSSFELWFAWFLLGVHFRDCKNIITWI